MISDAWEYAHQHPDTAEARLSLWRPSDIDKVSDAQQLPVLAKVVLGFVNIPLHDYLEASSAGIDDTDSFGRTALYWAASRGDYQSVKSLLIYGANVSIAEQTGLTALHIADSALVVRILLEFGAKINKRDRWDRTPLHWACYQGKPTEVVQELLINGADIHAVRLSADSDGIRLYALHMATEHGYVDLVECLLDSGALIDVQTQPTGLTPLFLAVMGNKLDIIETLLKRGADVTVRNSAGETLLHAAAAFATSETIGLLSDLAQRSIFIDVPCRTGRMAWDIMQLRVDKTPALQDDFGRLLGK